MSRKPTPEIAARAVGRGCISDTCIFGEILEAKLVGVRGFEPPAPASRRQCSTKLSYTPKFASSWGGYSIEQFPMRKQK